MDSSSIDVQTYDRKNVKVINPWFGQNNDAIDMESCQYGILDNCYFDTGDDAITLKSGRDEEGRKRGIPTENWLIKIRRSSMVMVDL